MGFNIIYDVRICVAVL